MSTENPDRKDRHDREPGPHGKSRCVTGYSNYRDQEVQQNDRKLGSRSCVTSERADGLTAEKITRQCLNVPDSNLKPEQNYGHQLHGNHWRRRFHGYQERHQHDEATQTNDEFPHLVDRPTGLDSILRQ